MELVEIKYQDTKLRNAPMLAGKNSQKLADYYEKLGGNHYGRFEK